MPTNMDDTITLQGSSVEIHRESEGAVDDYGDPAPTWAKAADETAWIQSMATYRTREVYKSLGGRLDEGDYIGFFKSNSAVQDNDVIVDGSTKYEVIKVFSKGSYDATNHKEAILKLMEEG